MLSCPQTSSPKNLFLRLLKSARSALPTMRSVRLLGSLASSALADASSRPASRMRFGCKQAAALMRRMTSASLSGRHRRGASITATYVCGEARRLDRRAAICALSEKINVSGRFGVFGCK